MGLLPKPKQVVQVVGKVPKPAQPMIPYTLTRRPTPTTKTKRKAKPSKPTVKTTEDSDSDGEPTSFFSLLERTEESASAAVSDWHVPMLHSHPAEPSVGPTPIPDAHSAAQHADYVPVPMPDSHPAALYAGFGVDTAPSAPKPFSLGEESGWSYPEPGLGTGWGEDQPVDETAAAEVEQSAGEAGPLLGVGPGLSMDEEAVSSHCIVANFHPSPPVPVLSSTSGDHGISV